MKWLLYIAIWVFLPALVHAQVTGTVADETGNVLEQVLVVNPRTQSYTYTNEKGIFNLNAKDEDTVVFMKLGFRIVKKEVRAIRSMNTVELEHLVYSMDEVEIQSEIERYKQEHAEMLKTYDKTFKDAERKPKMTPYAGTMAGVTVDGLISDFASRISGQKKKDKRFKNDFERTENEKFIAIKYNPEVVMLATHTSADSAALFIQHHPMEIDFAREASFLEIQMWIRQHFDLWTEQKKEAPELQKPTK